MSVGDLERGSTRRGGAAADAASAALRRPPLCMQECSAAAKAPGIRRRDWAVAVMALQHAQLCVQLCFTYERWGVSDLGQNVI